MFRVFCVLQEAHGDGAVDDDAARPVRLTPGRGDPPQLHQAQDLELVEQAGADAPVHRLLGPLSHVQVPQGRVVRRHRGDAPEDVQGSRSVPEHAVEPLAVGVVDGALGNGVGQVGVGEAVHGGEDSLDGGEGAVVAADRDPGQPRREGDVLERRGEVHGGVHGDVEDGLREGETGHKVDLDRLVAGANGDHLGVQVPVESIGLGRVISSIGKIRLG